jgi:pyroglutamyl-peptidase
VSTVRAVVPTSVIVTGFEPFGGRAVNRSWQAVERVTLRAGWQRVQLPVVYARIAEIVPALVGQQPRAVLLVGEADRQRLTLERVARNATDPASADNAGEQRAQVHDGGAAELVATWDLDRALAAARKIVAAEISDDAGGYCCNAALYHALRAAAPGIRVGFVHVPHSRWPFGPRLSTLGRALDAIANAMLE